MSFWLQNIGQFILMLVLLALSAFFSGAETAFFNLSHRQVQSLRSARSGLGHAAALLLSNPKRLLTSLLFANMTVNVCYFALSSVLSVNINARFGHIAAGAGVVLSFGLLVLCGEMLPKSIAYASSEKFTLAATPLCYLLARFLAPLLVLFDLVVIEPAIRLLTGASPSAGRSGLSRDELTSAQFKLLIEASRRHGLIGEAENQLLAQVIELGLLKVRHVMVPRVDMLLEDVHESSRHLAHQMRRNDVTKIPVYENHMDNIIGVVHLRDLMLNPLASPKSLVCEIDFIPEQKTVESLLEYFRTRGTDLAVVVDEYGGIAGTVTMENIVYEMLSPIDESADQVIEQLGPMRYRLSGSIPIHDWAHIFDIDVEQQARLATLSGFVTARLGKIPAAGDTLRFHNLTLMVERMDKNRIQSIVLTLMPISGDGK